MTLWCVVYQDDNGDWRRTEPVTDIKKVKEMWRPNNSMLVDYHMSLILGLPEDDTDEDFHDYSVS